MMPCNRGSEHCNRAREAYIARALMMPCTSEPRNSEALGTDNALLQ